MRRIKLSGWARVGVLLSIIWALGVIGLTLNQYYLSTTHESSALVLWEESRIDLSKVIWDEPPKNGDTFDPDAYLKKVKEQKGLSQKQIDALSLKPRFRWDGIAAYTLIPPLVGWLLVIVCWMAVSWVAAGFRENGRK